MPYLRMFARASVLLVLMSLSIGAAWPQPAHRPYEPRLTRLPAAEKSAVAASAGVTPRVAAKRVAVVAGVGAKPAADGGDVRVMSRRASTKAVSRPAAKARSRSGTEPERGLTSASTRTRSSSGSSLSRAKSLLAAQVDRYPILAGTTVEFGDARGYQAISYYQSGRIVISESHTASLDRIIAHEVWHVIDWRDDGDIDWGENIPPKSSIVAEFRG